MLVFCRIGLAFNFGVENCTIKHGELSREAIAKITLICVHDKLRLGNCLYAYPVFFTTVCLCLNFHTEPQSHRDCTEH